jgi:hypothetical protein
MANLIGGIPPYRGINNLIIGTADADVSPATPEAATTGSLAAQETTFWLGTVTTWSRGPTVGTTS